MARLTVVGDALLDRDLDGRAERLAPDAPVPVVDAIEDRPRAGGAGLAATLAAAAGHEVTLVCALGDDAAGRHLLELLEVAGVRVRDLGCTGSTPEKVRVRADGRPLVRLDVGGGGRCGEPTAAALAEIADADAVLISDYGRGVAALPALRDALGRLRDAAPLVWDPHPRGPDPVAGVLLATPNAGEAARAGDAAAPGLAGAEAAGRALAARWRAVYVCVTMGARGALLVTDDPRQPPLVAPARAIAGGDPCGAGDCFAATAAGCLAAGALPSEAVRVAVAVASAFVEAGGAGAGESARTRPRVAGAPESAAALAARVRAAGGTVVATGGCFDLLHAGHVRLLEAARALGDCLIVCLNSDASVRRLKGSDRPVVGEADRAAVLAGLGAVDGVALFSEDDPRALLRRLRPHVWVKGGDYALADLPEREALEAWGGQTVTVPYVAGRSTTGLIDELRTVRGG